MLTFVHSQLRLELVDLGVNLCGESRRHYLRDGISCVSDFEDNNPVLSNIDANMLCYVTLRV